MQSPSGSALERIRAEFLHGPNESAPAKNALGAWPFGHYGARKFHPFRAPAMADKATPHFHNDPGVPVIHVGSKEFMCIGATPPFDHPHVFIDMGYDNETICSYCSTLFKYDPSLKADEARPAECVWEPDFATSPASR
jgi:uncharacterized Zn-finger protein